MPNVVSKSAVATRVSFDAAKTARDGFVHELKKATGNIPAAYKRSVPAFLADCFEELPSAVTKRAKCAKAILANKRMLQSVFDFDAKYDLVDNVASARCSVYIRLLEIVSGK
jgi:hypothetical protein